MSGNKLGRHIGNKHAEIVKKPKAANIRAIADLITKESRRSFSLVPMAAIKQTVGHYWDDRCYRSIVHR